MAAAGPITADGEPSTSWNHYHHDDYGGLIVGDIAVGPVGGIIGKAI